MIISNRLKSHAYHDSEIISRCSTTPLSCGLFFEIKTTVSPTSCELDQVPGGDRSVPRRVRSRPSERLDAANVPFIGFSHGPALVGCPACPVSQGGDEEIHTDPEKEEVRDTDREQIYYC